MKKKITVIGGGTGQANLLRGLKNYNIDLTAVVTMADDGGGSGKLRQEIGMLPPGDIRNCIIALSDIEPAMETLMQHRFKEGSLKGQSFGNLFLAALNEIYGDFELAISKISEILAVRGRVLPVTLEDIHLVAKLSNGNLVNGESNIAQECINQSTRIDKIFLRPSNVDAFPEVIDRINNSDIIVLGPGSLYTSIIPNLLVADVAKAIYESKAVKIYVSNIMTEYGETTGYSIYNHMKAILDHSIFPIIDKAIINKKDIPGNILQKYLYEGQTPLFLDKKQKKQILELGIEVIQEDLITIKNELLIHDSDKISKVIMDLAKKTDSSKINQSIL